MNNKASESQTQNLTGTVSESNLEIPWDKFSIKDSNMPLKQRSVIMDNYLIVFNSAISKDISIILAIDLRDGNIQKAEIGINAFKDAFIEDAKNYTYAKYNENQIIVFGYSFRDVFKPSPQMFRMTITSFQRNI